LVGSAIVINVQIPDIPQLCSAQLLQQRVGNAIYFSHCVLVEVFQSQATAERFLKR
jgi:hypothetical protein